MSAASDSNDASDIFWPGYVDAVTNLAINLLFVIAVMSIVVLSSVLQMAKLKPEDYVPKTSEVTQGQDSATNASTTSPATQPALVQSAKQLMQAVNALKQAAQNKGQLDGNTEQEIKALLSALDQSSNELAPGKLEKMLADKAAAEKLSAEQEEALKKLQKELQALKTGQALQKSQRARDDDTGGTADTSGRADVVNATQNRQAPKTGPSQLQTLNAGGLVVVFDTDVVELSDKEVSELVKKMAEISPLNQGRWLIQVVSPKGFSEATRLGYYRVNSIRNALLKNGVQASAIDMRVVESEGSGANNARVLVRPAQ